MKKKILAILAAAMVTSSVGLASPLTDYSPGKTAVDITYRNTETQGHAVVLDPSLDRKYNVDLGITTGLGNNFALQYRHFQPKSDNTGFTVPFSRGYEVYNESNDSNYDIMAKSKVKLEEINLLYKIDNNLSAYMGVMRTKLELSGSFNYNSEDQSVNLLSGNLNSKTRNLMQVGLIGTSKINDKLTAYGSVGLGKDLTSYQVGLSYAIEKNLEFNVDYRNVRVDKYSVHGSYNTINDREVNTPISGDPYGVKPDVKVSGVGFGLTYKF